MYYNDPNQQNNTAGAGGETPNQENVYNQQGNGQDTGYSQQSNSQNTDYNQQSNSQDTGYSQQGRCHDPGYNHHGGATETYGSYNGVGAGSRYNPLGSEDETAPLNGQQSGGSYSGYNQQSSQQNGYYGQQGGYNGGAYNGSENATYSSVPSPNQQQQSSYQAPHYTAEPPQPPKPPKKKKKSGITGGRAVALAVICALLGCGAGFGGAYAALTITGNSTKTDNTTVYASDRTSVTATTELVEAGDEMTTAQIYEAYNDSVVCITVSTSSGTGAGTGFFISDDGYIMTCYHVVEDQEAMSVTLSDGSTSYEATYVGGDDDQDVAIIKIEATDGETFHGVTLGDSSLISVGDTVVSIGNALGELANTTTEGIVSALDRAITMSDGTVMNLLQTDCTINSGNSGGPLFNAYGEVIGIVNAKYSSSAYDTSTATIEGIGFAIPINDAVDIMNDLMEYGYVTGKPYLGISVSTISSIMAQMYPDQYVVGAYVNSVNEGSCAETAGLQAGDIITAVDGVEITSSAELIDAKGNHKAGEEMTLLVYRSGEYYTITVTLDEEQPEETTSSDSSESESDDGSSDGNSFPWGGSGSSGNSGNGFGGSGNSGW
ncbi:MAG: trypsin-like peptidase domain-containing protein [Clostridiales bacterium]|nr:trypsin-like peptidase domain-containing protein [Clostridiales bacterium]